MPEPIVGIDLGTTHSLVAVFEDGVTRVLTGPAGSPLIPSVVAVDGTGHLVVGQPAADLAVSRPEQAASRFKPDMGTADARRFGGHALSPTSLSALVLTELRQLAERALGSALGPVVITVPAWFREPQRRATLEAGQLAGLHVRHLLNEPTAAALAYGLDRDDAEETVVVLDLGGGTFDVTVLELFDGVVDVRSSMGDVHLGGEDVTDAIVAAVQAEDGAVAVVDPEARARLRHAAEVVKRRLSSQDEAVLRLGDAERPVTRAELEAWCAPLTARMRRCVREAMMQAGVRASEVTQVLLVGGATRMPLVADLARDLFGREPRLADDVDAVVARGAAVHAAMLQRHGALRERVVTDVLTHSLGVGTRKHWGEQVFDDRFDPILARGTALPATNTSSYQTLHAEQTAVTFKVYEGEHRDALKNTHIATLTLADLPVHPDQPEAREALLVRMTQDTSGLLEVEATVVSTGEAARVVLERTVRPLSEDERREGEAVLDRLRTHPRELLPNRYLLERGTRLVSMLAGEPREVLDRLLTAFEASLERPDPAVQDALRAQLATRCDALAATYDLDLPT